MQTEFASPLPLERVWEIHLAGGEAIAGFFTDAHSGLVEPELMEMTAEVASRLPNLQAIIFEIMPERVPAAGLAAIAGQLGQLKDLWAARRPGAAGAITVESARPPTGPEITPEVWEALLGCASAVSGVRYFPPSEKLSVVILRMPRIFMRQFASTVAPTRRAAFFACRFARPACFCRFAI